MKNKIFLMSLLIFSLASMGVNAEEKQVVAEHDIGKKLFSEKCGMCHREMGMGTGILMRRMDPEVAILEKRQNLTVPFVSHVVRNGLNTMFAISRAEVSDEQLIQITTYLSKGSE